MEPEKQLEDGFKLRRWTVLPAENSVSDRFQRHELEPRVMKLLVLLARHQGEVLDRDQLLNSVWGDVMVQEDSLTKAVSDLRRILEDDPATPRYIRTIRKGGYQLIAAVDPVADGIDPDRLVGRWIRVTAVLLVLALIAALWLRPPQPGTERTAEFSSIRISRVTSFAGQELDPQLSPDGNQVVFVRNDSDHPHQLFVKPLNSPRLIQLTDTVEEDRFPAWSPDGQDIAFLRRRTDSTALMVVPSLGGSPRELVSVRHSAMGLAWSGDGQRLYLASRETEAEPSRITEWTLDPGQMRYWTDPPESFDGDRAVQVHWPSGRIGFLRHNRQGEIQFVHMLAPGEEQVIHQEQGANLSFSWLAGDGGIVFDRLVGSEYAIRRLDPSGTVSSVPGLPGRVLFPRAHPFLPRMVFLEVEVRRDVQRLDLSEADPIAAPLIESTQMDFDAYPSHHGSRIAFISSRTGQMQLHLSDPDGNMLAQLTAFDGTTLASPKWSPDDRRIALQVNEQGANRIVLIDVERHSVEPLVDDGFINVKPAWWNDDTVLFGSDRSGRWEIWSIRPSDGAMRQLSRNGGRIAKPGPNGNLLVTKPEQQGLWLLDPNSGEDQLLIEDLDLRDLNNWVVDANSILHVRRVNGEAILHRFDLTNGTATRLARLPQAANVSIALSDDQRYLLYTSMPPPASDVLLAEWQ